MEFSAGGTILLCLLLASVLGVAGGRRPPKILQDNGKDILVEEEKPEDDPLTLECVGDEPVVWSFIYNNKEKKGNAVPVKAMYENYSYASELKIDSMDDQGHYYCHYEGANLEDETGQDYAHVYIYLYAYDEGFASVEHDEMQFLIRKEEGKPLNLDCRPTRPNINVTVYHNDEIIHEGPLEEPRFGYRLRNITSDKEGTYKCVLNGEPRSFEVHSLSKPMISQAKNTYAVVGHSLKLWCRILDRRYASEPVFTWILPNSGDHQETENITKHEWKAKSSYRTSYLTINNISLNDTGFYKCHVNVVGYLPSYQTKFINVTETLESFVDITSDPHSRIYKEGDNVTWSLQVESFPLDPYLIHNNSFIHDFKASGDLTLKMSDVAFSDFGLYTLNVTTKDNKATKSETFMLRVESATRLQISDEERSVLLNSNVTVSCKAWGYPLENISWSYRGCGEGQCVEPFQWVQDSEVTVTKDQENFKASQYVFTAKETVNVRCKCSNVVKEATFIVSDIDKPFSFAYIHNGIVTDVLTNKETSVTESFPLNLTCAVMKHHFDSVSFTFKASPIGSEKVIDESTNYTFRSTIVFNKISKNDAGTYECVASSRGNSNIEKHQLILNVDDLIPVRITSDANMKVGGNKITMSAKESFSFNCLVTGTPEITIKWSKDGKPLPRDFGEFQKRSQVIKISDLSAAKHSGRYECRASNNGGTAVGSLTLGVEVEGMSLAIKITLWIVVCGIIILVVVVLVLSSRVRKDLLKRRETKRNLAFLFEQGRPNELNPDCAADEQAELLPYNRKWEVDRDRIQIGRQLGAGAFGRVVKACVSNLELNKPTTTVALKMCKTQADASQLRALTLELKIMIHLGKHLNIVNLLGAHTSRVSRGELWILVEYCQYGSLLSFLHRHRQTFVNVIDPLTGAINLSGTGDRNMSPFSPLPPTSPTSPKSPKPPVHSGMEDCELIQTTSSGFSSRVSGPSDLCGDGPHTFSVLPDTGDEVSSKEDSQGNRQPSPPRIFNFENAPGLAKRLTKGMNMVANPAYHNVPVSDRTSTPAPVEEAMDNEGREKAIRKPSLMAQDSHGNFFMYDKSSIPGVASSFTTVDLLCWAWQVAEGMDYLARRKVLHGDLAVRNLLLAQDNVVKISDFGLSRDIYKSEVYMKQTNELMPVKWMAVEAIRDRIFTVQSDVWAFGVTLWELFTLGSTPYPGVSIDHSFLQKLEKGFRMDKPNYANNDIYQLMLQCWEDFPCKRPDFRGLADTLSHMLMPETTQHYNDKNNAYLNFNEERFRNETDYLGMCAAPEFSNLCKEDGVPQGEGALDAAGAVTNDLYVTMDRQSVHDNLPKLRIPSDNSGYLPMSSTGTPTPACIFSPRRPSEDEVFSFTNGNVRYRKTSEENRLPSDQPPANNLKKNSPNMNNKSPVNFTDNEDTLISDDVTSGEPLPSVEEEDQRRPSEERLLSLDNTDYINAQTVTPNATSSSLDVGNPVTSPGVQAPSYMNLQTVR